MVIAFTVFNKHGKSSIIIIYIVWGEHTLPINLFLHF